MELDKKDKHLIETAISEWQENELLDSQKADELRSTLHVKKSEALVARYFFIIAIASTILAFGAIFIDDKLLEKIKAYFDVGNIIIAVSCTIIAVAWFIYMTKKRKGLTPMLYEVYMLLGGLVSICALVYYCKDFGFGPEYTAFLLITSLLFFILSYIYRSYTLWVGALLALMGWYGAYAYHWNDKDNLFIGLNYPMRFTIFGLLVIGFSFIQKRIKALQFTFRQTYIIGLLIFFTGLWGVSIFGNYGHYDQWEQVRQIQVIGYSIVMAICSVGALLYGIKYDDEITRDFGIIFILVNLYSRYFEFFWDNTNKGVFFLILALSFGILGFLLERKLKRNKKQQNSISVAE